jgi:MFS family permease
MKDNECKRNIILYCFYVIFNEPLFWGPVLIISLQKLAFMSLSEIYYMESVVICVCLLFDIPAGALADLIGRKRTMILGRLFLLGSTILFAFMVNPLQAWVGNILWAIGFSLQSGADTALFYDTLGECKREKDYKRLEGKFIGFRLFLIAVCSLVVGFLAEINLRFPLYLCIPLMTVPFLASFFMREPIKTKEYSFAKQISTLKEGITFVIHSKQVRWMVGFSALIGVASHLWFFTYNPYFEFVGVSLKQYGYIFFGINIIGWIFSYAVQKIETRIGEKWCIIGMIFCIAVPILLMGLIPIWPFAYLVLVSGMVYGFRRPFVSDYVNRHIPKEIRATTLSVQSSLTNFASILSLACFGFCITNFNLLNSLLLLGGVVLLLGTFSYRTYRKINNPGL